MVWKKIKELTEEEAKHISKRAVKVTTKPLFYYAHTRKGKELNLAKNCKRTAEKKLTLLQSKAYNQILDDERMKNDPKFYKSKSKR